MNANGDRKPRFECSCCKRCTECFTGKDNISGHYISAQIQHFKDHLKSHHQTMVGVGKLLLSITKNSRFDNHQLKLDPHVRAKELKLELKLWSDQFYLPPGKCGDESFLECSYKISWGDSGIYIFDPPNCFSSKKQTCGPGQRLQEHFSGDKCCRNDNRAIWHFFEEKCCRKHNSAIGHSCKRNFNCPKHQEFEDQRGLRPNIFLWDCARSSGITEEQLTWIIQPNFKPFGITSNRPRYQKAKSEFLQSVALERYLSDYNRSEHLAYLASRRISCDASNGSNASIETLSFTCSGATLSVQVKQGKWCCLFRLPKELNVGLTVDDLRATFDGQDVDTR